MDDDQKTRHELLGKFRDDILRHQLSNTENYDKAVLSLSTAFLGFSLAFLKDFTPYCFAKFAYLLPCSWILFGVSIIATIGSFFASQAGLSTQLKYAEKYYLEQDDSYLKKENRAAVWTNYLNRGSAFAFTFAVVATIIFTSINLSLGGNMSDKKSYGTMDGASIPIMQPSTVSTHGAQIPAMQQVPQPAPAQVQTGGQTTAPTPSGNTSSSNK